MDEILKEIKKIKEIIKKTTKETMKKSCRFTVAFYVSFIVTAVVFIGCIVCYFVGDMHICNPSQTLYSFVPVLLCILYLIFAFLLIRALLKSAKYFSKLDVLEKLMALDSKNNQNTNTDGSNQDKQNNQNANINDKELIKKYCDTLVDL